MMIHRRDYDIAAGLAPLRGVAEDGRGIWILPQATFRGIEERDEPPFELGEEFPGHDIPWSTRSAEWSGRCSVSDKRRAILACPPSGPEFSPSVTVDDQALEEMSRFHGHRA